LKKFDSISINGVGGRDKAEFLAAAIMNIGLDQEHLSIVLEDVFSGFGHRYMSLEL
jgi:hypothetical protein